MQQHDGSVVLNFCFTAGRVWFLARSCLCGVLPIDWNRRTRYRCKDGTCSIQWELLDAYIKKKFSSFQVELVVMRPTINTVQYSFSWCLHLWVLLNIDFYIFNIKDIFKSLLQTVLNKTLNLHGKKKITFEL